jgi:hypothetical protein
MDASDETLGAIEAYIADLERALRGPRRARADLLTEARDSLIDATEAYERDGVERAAAERRALREFGAVDTVAPGYQTELSMAQGHRTAVIMLLTLVAQPIVWNSAVLPVPVGDPAPVAGALGDIVEWFGGGAIAGAVLAVLACGVGVRLLGAGRAVARITGAFALTVCAVLAVLGCALTIANAAQAPPAHIGDVVWLIVFLLAPLAWVARSAHRCLHTG